MKRLIFIFSMMIGVAYGQAGGWTRPNPGAHGTMQKGTGGDSANYIPAGCGAPTTIAAINKYTRPIRMPNQYLDTCAHKYYFYDPALDSWDSVHVGSSPTGNAWLKTGNAGTNPSINFVGTTDATDLVFATNGISNEIGRLSGDGNYRVRFGLSNTASGIFSSSFNRNNTASGSYSGTFGQSNTASGNSSFAINNSNTASGDHSFVSGFTNKSKSYAGTVIGTFNDSTNANSGTGYNGANRAFQVGNGTANNARSNAFTVLFNGKTGVGTVIPDSTLQVNGSLKFVTGRQAAGNILVSASDGGADWIAPSSIVTAPQTLQVVTAAGNTTTTAININNNKLIFNPTSAQQFLNVNRPTSYSGAMKYVQEITDVSNGDGTYNSPVVTGFNAYGEQDATQGGIYYSLEPDYRPGGAKNKEAHLEVYVPPSTGHPSGETSRLYSSTFVQRDSLGNSSNQWDFRGGSYALSTLKSNTYVSAGGDDIGNWNYDFLGTTGLTGIRFQGTNSASGETNITASPINQNLKFNSWSNIYFDGNNTSTTLGYTKSTNLLSNVNVNGDLVMTKNASTNRIVFDAGSAAYKAWLQVNYGTGEIQHYAASGGYFQTFYHNNAEAFKTIAGGLSVTTGFQIGGAATSRKLLIGNGTNFVASTETWAVPGTSGNVLTSDGTNWTSATPTAASPAGNSGDLQINTGSAFATPANDSLKWTASAGTLNVKGSVTATLNVTGLNVTANGGNLYADGQLQLTGNVRLSSAAGIDGVGTLLGAGSSGWSRLNLGGNTSANPAVARNGTGVIISLADATAGASLGVGMASATGVSASAIFEATSTTKGSLIPRMTTTQMNAISSPATGLSLYNTDAKASYEYNGANYQSTGIVSGSYNSGAVVAQTTFTVTFGGTQPNSTYHVNVAATSLLGAAVFYVNNKTTTTFDVVYLSGLTGTLTFDFQVAQ